MRLFFPNVAPALMLCIVCRPPCRAQRRPLPSAASPPSPHQLQQRRLLQGPAWANRIGGRPRHPAARTAAGEGLACRQSSSHHAPLPPDTCPPIPRSSTRSCYGCHAGGEHQEGPCCRCARVSAVHDPATHPMLLPLPCFRGAGLSRSSLELQPHSRHLAKLAADFRALDAQWQLQRACKPMWRSQAPAPTRARRDSLQIAGETAREQPARQTRRGADQPPSFTPLPGEPSALDPSFGAQWLLETPTVTAAAHSGRWAGIQRTAQIASSSHDSFRLTTLPEEQPAGTARMLHLKSSLPGVAHRFRPASGPLLLQHTALPAASRLGSAAAVLRLRLLTVASTVGRQQTKQAGGSSSSRPATALARLKASQALSSPRPSHVGAAIGNRTPGPAGLARPGTCGLSCPTVAGADAVGALGALKRRRLASMVEQLAEGEARPSTAPC